MVTFELKCQKCGGELKESGRLFECEYCHAKYESDSVEKEKAALASLLDEQKQEQLANHRHMLWDAIHAEYIDSESIVEISRSLRRLLPEDFSARFFELANSATPRQINGFLRTVDLTDPMQAFWAEEIVKFMIRSLQAENLLAVQSFIERAYKNVDLEKYEKYSTIFSTEAKRVKGGVYEPNEPRDVFVMYSSWDIKFVEELVEYLEEKGITCFVALRNLQHGRGAVENYQRSIEKAMKACRTVVFVSSKHSRSFSCDATRIELPYLLENGKNKPRVEYCLDSESGGSGLVKEYFAGLERVYSKEEAGKRIEKGLASLVLKKEEKKETQEKICLACGAKNPQKAKFCLECGGHEFAANEQEKFDREKAAREEAERKNKALLEELNRLKEEKAAAEKAAAEKAEAEKKRLAEQAAKRAEEEKERKEKWRAEELKKIEKERAKREKEEQAKKQAAEFFLNHRVGDVVEGKVERATPYGAVVSVDGVDCLAHISDLSWTGVKAVTDVLEISKTYPFKVLKLDPETKRVSIGYKQLQPQPWDLVAEKYAEGDVIHGKVVRIMQFGAFVEVEKGIDGLVHVSEISHEPVENPETVLTVGQQIDAKIIKIDSAEKRMMLSIKALKENLIPADEICKKAQEHYNKHEYAQAKALFEQAANLGSAEGQVGLGWCYLYGYAVGRNYQKAEELFTPLAKQGNAEAQYGIGNCYHNKAAFEKDEAKKKAIYLTAFAWYENAALQGYAKAESQVAAYYRCGFGVEKDYNKHQEWLEKAVKNGDIQAQYDLAEHYKYGMYGYKKDLEQAFKWYQKIAEQKKAYSGLACLNLGEFYENGIYVQKDLKQAYEYYFKAFAEGLNYAGAKIGTFYENGIYPKKDLKQAFEWYHKAATGKYSADDAIENLGRCYENGIGVEKDLQKALEWYQKLRDYVTKKKEHIARVQAAIEQSKKAGQAPVPKTPVPQTPTEKTPADLYLEGKVLYDRRDYKRSFPLFLQAAEKGHSTAQYWVGHSYSQGLGVTANLFKAFEWYQKAAKQGNTQAQYCVGHAYHFGKGVEKDKQKAVEWFTKAVKNGDNYSRTYLREYGLCQHCGGEFKGLFNKVCTACGKKKDY